MRICWVTNDVWFSRLLRFLFKETTSHVGVTCRVNNIDLALDINNPYGSLYSLKFWLKKYKIIHSVTIPLSEEDNFRLFKILEEKCVLKEYDIKAYYFGMICGLLNKLFKIPFPKKNAWVIKDKDMCQEIVRYVLEFYAVQKEIGVLNPDLTVMTPDMSMHYMVEVTKNTNWEWTHNV